MRRARWFEIEGMPGLEHRDGIMWMHAKSHHGWQRHRAQTRGVVNGEYVERCSCGAYGPTPWTGPKGRPPAGKRGWSE